MNYYCLIAGFPNLELYNTKNVPSPKQLLEEWYEELTPRDAELLRLLLMKNDNQNLLTYLADRTCEINSVCNLSKDDWQDLITQMDEIDMPSDKRLMPYVLTYYRAVTDEKTKDEIPSKEDFITSLYYDFGCQSKNKFVSEWFEFNLNINNVMTAIICRKHNFDIKKAIIGNNEIAQTIRTSNARDFNLTELYTDFEVISKIVEEPNLLERERKIDALKWNWLEEHAFFHYFSIERVLSLWLKCELINRWKELSVEKGEHVFRNLLNDFKKDIKL